MIVLRYWREIALAAAVLLVFAGGGYVEHLRGAVHEAHEAQVQAQARAAQNAQVAHQLKGELARREQIREQLRQMQQRTADSYGELRADIQRQLQQSSDALRRCARVRVGSDLLDRLRDGAGAGAGGDGEDHATE